MDEKDFQNIISKHDTKRLLTLSDSEKENFFLKVIYDHLSGKPLAELNEVQKTLFLASSLEDVCQADSLPSLSEDARIFLALPEIKAAYERLGALKTAALLDEFISLVPEGFVPEWEWFFEPQRKDIIGRIDGEICNYPDGVMSRYYVKYMSVPKNAEMLLDGLM